MKKSTLLLVINFIFFIVAMIIILLFRNSQSGILGFILGAFWAITHALSVEEGKIRKEEEW